MNSPRRPIFYDILEIDADASPYEIRRAYQELHELYAHDSLASYSFFREEERKELLGELEKAYLTLIDPELRREYDQSLIARGLLQEELSYRERARAPAPLYAFAREASARVDRRPRRGASAAAGQGAGPGNIAADGATASKIPSDGAAVSVVVAPAPATPETASPEVATPEAASMLAASEAPSNEAAPKAAGHAAASPEVAAPEAASILVAPEIPSYGATAPASAAAAGAAAPVAPTAEALPPPAPLGDLDIKGSLSGPDLRDLRMRAGITLEDIAARSKIKVSTLEAMERDRYDLLPPLPYLRGFLKIYAQIIHCDPEGVSKGYLNQLQAARGGSS
ncbi:MAG: helix-turn-helix domain-containing protein [Pseudomonadota bacterium]|nr:helix-turn-helix domain-containing protein [Pseudomonadota bacterium]